MLKVTISLESHEDEQTCHFNRGSQATLVEGDRLASPPAIERRVYCGIAPRLRHGGPKAIERVRRTQPAAYLKILTLLSRASIRLSTAI